MFPGTAIGGVQRGGTCIIHSYIPRCATLTDPIQILKLPQSSLAELARNSVIQSGFEMEVKRHWLGQEWYLPGAAGNDIHKVRNGSCPFILSYTSDVLVQTNVPDIRLAYRHRTLVEELAMIRTTNAQSPTNSNAGVLPTSDAVAARAMAKHA